MENSGLLAGMALGLMYGNSRPELQASEAGYGLAPLIISATLGKVVGGFVIALPGSILVRIPRREALIIERECAWLP